MPMAVRHVHGVVLGTSEIRTRRQGRRKPKKSPGQRRHASARIGGRFLDDDKRDIGGLTKAFICSISATKSSRSYLPVFDIRMAHSVVNCSRAATLQVFETVSMSTE